MFGIFKSKYNLINSGLMKGMTDIHSHVLPGVDDGSPDINTSLSLLRYMESIGLREVWLTPHIMEDIPNTNAGLRERFQELKEKFRKPEDAYCGTVELNLAAEYMMDNLFAERLEADDLLPIYEGGYRYLLVETTGFTPPMNLLPVLKRIQTKGYRPLLAHPERYLYMGTSYYCMLKQEQVAFQLNLPSLTGAYGTYIQKKAVSLLKAGMYDLTGTDTHSSKHFKEWLGTRIGSRDRDMLWAHFPACRDGL